MPLVAPGGPQFLCPPCLQSPSQRPPWAASVGSGGDIWEQEARGPHGTAWAVGGGDRFRGHGGAHLSNPAPSSSCVWGGHKVSVLQKDGDGTAGGRGWDREGAWMGQG